MDVDAVFCFGWSFRGLCRDDSLKRPTTSNNMTMERLVIGERYTPAPAPSPRMMRHKTSPHRTAWRINTLHTRPRGVTIHPPTRQPRQAHRQT